MAQPQSQDQQSPAQGPATMTPSPAEPRPLACPRCYSIIPQGAGFCPRCGAAVPPPAWGQPLPYAAPTQPRRNWVPIVIGVVIVLVVIASFGVSYVLAAGAADSVDNGVFCASTSSNVNPLALTGTVKITYGVENPSSVGVHATWTLSIDYGGGVFLTDTRSFDVPAHSKTYAIFTYTITAFQASQIQNSSPTVEFVRDYSALAFGFHRTSSTTVSSSSSSSSGSSLPNC